MLLVLFAKHFGHQVTPGYVIEPSMELVKHAMQIRHNACRLATTQCYRTLCQCCETQIKDKTQSKNMCFYSSHKNSTKAYRNETQGLEWVRNKDNILVFNGTERKSMIYR